jgi:hypothetical protein
MSPRFPIFASSSEARTATLQSLLIAAIVITGLYVAREVLLPLALAILLSFVLTPALLFLRRLKVPRVVGVAIVVAFAFALIFGLGWLMSHQATQLAGDLPRYQHVLAEKISALRKSAAGSPVLEKASEAVKGLERELANPTPKPKVGTEPGHISFGHTSGRSDSRFSAEDRFEQLLQLQIKAVAVPATSFTAVQHFQKLDTARAAKGLLGTMGICVASRLRSRYGRFL